MVFQLVISIIITVLGLTAFFMLRHMRKHLMEKDMVG